MSSIVSTMTVTVIPLIGSGGIVLIISLIAILIGKEVISTSDDPKMLVLAQSLDLAIVPLLIGFALIIVVRIIDSLK